MELGLEAQVLWLLIIAAAVAMLTKQLRLPYTIALVAVGIVMGLLDLLPRILLTPELVFHLFLPVLLFEAAFNIDILDLRRNAVAIGILALPGVLIAAAVTAAVLYAGMQAWAGVAEFPWVYALLFGAVVAATDPISVLALFKELGVTRRLSLLLEGESIFNDGVAVVLFGLLLEAARGGELSVLGGARHFAVAVLGGGAIGVLLGLTAAKIMSMVDDHLIEITITTVLAFSAYLLAEQMHLSGVMAVIGAGLLTGNYGTRVAMSPTTRISVSDFWEYAAFLVNSVLFLMIGIEVKLVDFWPLLPAVAAAVLAMLCGRAVALAAAAPLINRLDEPLPRPWLGVLFWGGIRGAICMVLALSLPLDMAHRQLLMTMIFGVVIFTLLGQGLTIKGVLRRLRLIGVGVPEDYELRRGRLFALGRAREELEVLAARGALSPRTYETLRAALEERIAQVEDELDLIAASHEGVIDREAVLAERRVLHAEKDGIREAYLNGIISEAVMKRLLKEIDQRLHDLDATKTKEGQGAAKIRPLSRPPNKP